MKITSKSILSPGRGGVRDPPNSLSNSLSRRLKNSGSIKGGASPAMFPTTTAVKKRGSFENPEPSSPKVTCIGQVRVKGRKKQAKKLKSLSRRHSSNEVSFRKLDQNVHGFCLKNQTHKESLNLGSNGVQNQNQDFLSSSPSSVQRSWVHFPVTICDALRAFGSEFSCLFPCRKEEKMMAVEDGNNQGSCGVFARWLVAVQDGENGRRDIELVVGDDEEEDVEESVGFRKTRRHVFEDLEIVNDRIEGHKDEGRVSVCVPPKNALLLMRCRSDPVKIQALNNRSWEPNVVENDEEFEDVGVENQKVLILDQEQENVQQYQVSQSQEIEVVRVQEHDNVQKDDMGLDQNHEYMQKDGMGEEIVQENEVGRDQEVEIERKDEEFIEILRNDEVGQEHIEEKLEENEESLYLVTLFDEFVNQEMLTEIAEMSKPHEENLVKESKETEDVLPECLLMMMYEPKLSMEVSKETWVCSKDFIRRNSSKRKPPPMPAPATVNTGGGNQSKASTTTNGTTFAYDVMRMAEPPVLQQPARSSCSFPVASMATMLEEKLVNAVGYEPFVLTRCKSEPMKTAAAKLLPDSCVWENKKFERLNRGTFGVGAAGLGF